MADKRRPKVYEARRRGGTVTAKEYFAEIKCDSIAQTEEQALASLIESHRWQREKIRELYYWRARLPQWKRKIACWLRVP